jgi:GTPase
MFKSGFAAVIGRPNVGKSTLLNNLMGQKLLIVSDKPQTTRNRIHCILTTGEAQIIFLDTPGIHRPRHKLGQVMVKTALSTFKGVDLILFLVEGNTAPGPGDRYIARALKDIGTPVYLLINKMDLPAEGRDAIREQYEALLPFARVYEVSALEGTNLTEVTRDIIDALPEGPKYYPDDMVTDQPERFVAAELIREKILMLTHDEIPHSTAVVIEEMSERDTGQMMDIRAVIHVERDSQKGIVIGKGGKVLKEVGSLARKDLEVLLGSPVYLELWVKVKKEWRNKEAYLREFGYREE